MPKYILNNGVMFNDELYSKGQIVELKEEDAKGYLERGSIREYVEGEEESSDEATSSVEGETLREFELDGFTYKQIQAVEGVRYTQNDVEINEDAFVNAHQTQVRNEEEARLAAEAEANPQETETSTAPVPPSVNGNPTEEQIAEDLKAAGA